MQRDVETRIELGRRSGIDYINGALTDGRPECKPRDPDEGLQGINGILRSKPD
jgi:hypothetical protein